MKTPEPLKRRVRRLAGAHLTPKVSLEGSNVLTLSGHSKPFGIVESDNSLWVRFRDKASPSGMQEIDLTQWLDRRPIGLAVAEFLASRGSGTTAATRANIASMLAVFHDFLLDTESEGAAKTDDLGHVTTDVVNAYEVWLNRQVAQHPGKGLGQPWSANTKSARYGALVELFRHCADSRGFANAVHAGLRFKRNPWPGRHLHIRGRSVISHLDLTAIRKACIAELPAILAALELGVEARAMPQADLPPIGETSPRPYADMKTRLATLHHRHDDRLPSRTDLAASDPGLARSMMDPYGSVQATALHMHFTARTLVPFVLLLAIDGLFNAEGLLTLAWSQVDRSHPVFGPDRWRIRAEKARAGRAHHRSFASGLTAIESPVNLLRAVERFGASARSKVAPTYRDRVFVFWQARGVPFDSYGSLKGAATDKAWSLALEAFITENGLKPFTISSLRISGGDLIDAITGGDVKAKQVTMGHDSADTTDRSYQTTLGKQRGREALAVAMSWRERFLASGGRSDTRGEGLSEGRRTAATPGFGCFEPMFSPVPGQREGRACSAYGACPACPLAWVNIGDPRSRIRLTQLRERLLEARLAVHPSRWVSVWQPQLAAIDNIWMPNLPPVGSTTITLPPIPAVE